MSACGVTTDLDVALPSEDHLELLIDEALLETFPASDPPAPAIDAGTAQRVVPQRSANEPARRTEQ